MTKWQAFWGIFSPPLVLSFSKKKVGEDDQNSNILRNFSLQACASISVSKLCNFPLQCPVNFVNNLIIGFSPPKYLGLPVLTKYFVKKNICLCPEEGLNFLLFYPNFGPLLHLQCLKINIKAFPQRYRYGKYLSFATLVTPITELGDEQFAFPC